MIRRSFLKALCASPLGFLFKKKPETGCSVVGCWLSRVSGSTMCAYHRDFVEALIAGQRRTKEWHEFAAKRRSGTGFSAKRWADNGCPGLTSAYPHKRIWAEDDLTMGISSNNSPLYCWVSYEDYIRIPANLKFGNGENDIHASWDELGDVNGWYWKVS